MLSSKPRVGLTVAVDVEIVVVVMNKRVLLCLRTTVKTSKPATFFYDGIRRVSSPR